jgi:hypothetical protein
MFLEALRETSERRARSVGADATYWRAQQGMLESEDDEGRPLMAPYSKERMKPPRDKATEGRVNPKGIPCLYAATDPATAVSETRPPIGAMLTLAKIQPARLLRIIDCGSEMEGNPLHLNEPNPAKREAAVWSHLNKALSNPVSRADDVAEYAATQVIAEFFKTLGFDGIAYRSAFGEDGSNVAIFNPDGTGAWRNGKCAHRRSSASARGGHSVK